MQKNTPKICCKYKVDVAFYCVFLKKMTQNSDFSFIQQS